MNIQSTYLSDVENMTFEDILAAIANSQEFPLSCLNWKEFPYAPEVSFHVAHTDKALVVLFDVKEDHVRAVSLEANGPVWEDSCVEIFLAVPGKEGYFNFETNCIGTSLAAYRRSKTDADMFGPEQLGQIGTVASLPHEVIDRQGEGQEWTRETPLYLPLIAGMDTDCSLLSSRIPFSVVINIDRLVEQYLSEWYNGLEYAKNEVYGLEDSVTDIVISPVFYERMDIWEDYYSDPNYWNSAYANNIEEAKEKEGRYE